MADYSNLRKMWPAIAGHAYARGQRLADEDLFEALEQIEPPLLPDFEMKAIRRILRPRSGRPPANLPSREMLVQRVMSAVCPGVPTTFLEALADRLRRKKGTRQRELSGWSWRAQRRSNRASMIRFCYREIFQLLDGSSSEVIHPVIGRLKVPAEERTRSRQALLMAHERLRYLGMYPPALRTMMNIISRGNSLPFS